MKIPARGAIFLSPATLTAARSPCGDISSCGKLEQRIEDRERNLLFFLGRGQFFLAGGDQFLGDVRWHHLVVGKLHGKNPSPAGE